MPNRLIREGWLDSEAIDNLSPDAERFFLRLCLAADDAGRFDGRRDILRSRLFPLKFGLRSSDVEKLLKQCSCEGLVMPYEWDSKPFLQITKCQRCSPCTVSKFPDREGSHKIVYVKRDTRDGEKEFVLSSLIDGIGKGWQRDLIPSEPDPSKCTESGTESEASGGSQARFTPPTLKEAQDEAERLGMPRTEGDSFINRHQSTGWMIGKNKMKDWKAAMQTWFSNWKKFTGDKKQSFRAPAPPESKYGEAA